MKGYVILALLMLVPSMAYLQKQHFEKTLQPKLLAKVEQVLDEAGVEQAEAEIHWMDVRIKGRVNSVEKRVEVGRLVDEVPGVRLADKGNELLADGWLRLAREEGVVTATGLMPKSFKMELPVEIGRLRDEMERSKFVETPDEVLTWGSFIEQFFGPVGDRSVTLREGRLEMTGSATPGLRADWRVEGSKVVGKERVFPQFTLYPSVYHLPGYVPEAVMEPKPRERLREELRQSALFFQEGSHEVRASESGKVSRLATAMLTHGMNHTYVIGILTTSEPADQEVLELWADRIAAVMRLLKEYGVRYEQIEVIDFSPIREGGRDNGVEILLK